LAGGVWNLSLGDAGIPIFFPFFWRPKITVTCRLYYLQSQKTKRAFSVTKKMRWREFFGRQFTLRAFFNYRPTFDAEDMKRLLNLATPCWTSSQRPYDRDRRTAVAGIYT
jgi:hypothetical protein